MESQHQFHEQEIKENLEKVVSGYFKEFLNKFDNFNNQMRIAEVILKAYQLRIEKAKQKFSNVGDILATNYEEQKEFMKEVERLDRIDAQLTKIEIKLGDLVNRVESVDERLSKSAENNN